MNYIKAREFLLVWKIKNLPNYSLNIFFLCVLPIAKVDVSSFFLRSRPNKERSFVIRNWKIDPTIIKVQILVSLCFKWNKFAWYQLHCIQDLGNAKKKYLYWLLFFCLLIGPWPTQGQFIQQLPPPQIDDIRYHTQYPPAAPVTVSSYTQPSPGQYYWTYII